MEDLNKNQTDASDADTATPTTKDKVETTKVPLTKEELKNTGGGSVTVTDGGGPITA